MIGTYAAALAVCVASVAIGQALVTLCGRRRWSWAAPPVGLAVLCAVCWATVRLPGHGSISAIVALALVAASLAYLQGKGVWREAFAAGWPVVVLAALGASLPFIVEGHFGILGTGFNPDMSQHLLAADRLAHGHPGQLLRQGYPLGPHSIVVALNKGLDIGLVKGFSGLLVAVAVLAPSTALAAFRDLRPAPPNPAAEVLGLANVVASYFAQGASKETMLAFFLLGFVLFLREAVRDPVESQLRFVPAALIAVGSVYVYSFPALLWLLGTAVVWAVTEIARTHFRAGRSAAGGAPIGEIVATGPAAAALGPDDAPSGPADATFGPLDPTPGPLDPTPGPVDPTPGPALVRSVGIALAVLIVLVAPEIGRMIDFHKFETFDPNGPGLGNLFGQVSPFEALGIWPSGDFRLAPGDGAVPAGAYYLGAAFATVLLLYGIWACWRRRETIVLSGLLVAAVAYLAARVGGTAYTASKAIEIAAPLCALTILLPLAGEVVWSISFPMRQKVSTAACLVFLAAAGLCSALALANAPVGPGTYSPALTGLRPLVADGPTVVLASRELLEDDHGTNYIAWELRGGRVCIETREEAAGKPPTGVRYVVSEGSRHRPPFKGLRLRKPAPPYVLWEVKGPIAAQSPCPLIAVRQARQGPAR